MIWSILTIVIALLEVVVVRSFQKFGNYASITSYGRLHSTSLHATSIENDLLQAATASQKLQVQPMFEALVSNAEFVQKYWQKEPLLINSKLSNLEQSFMMEDVRKAVEEDFLEAGRGTFKDCETGWNMAAVSKPRGPTFEEAKLRYEDITVAMKQTSGTVVFNSAGGFMPPLSTVCLESVNAFQLPVAINVYLTDPGQQTSAPPHTDKQDVFVMHSQGMKRWRVYAPPPPAKMLRADPFARGKGLDVLSLAELQAPLIDTVLEPGQMLYIPAGFPHTTGKHCPFSVFVDNRNTFFLFITTDTVNIPDHSQPSVHMTLGVDTIIWGLTYAHLRGLCLGLATKSDKLVLTKLSPDLYFKLHSALPLGFMAAGLNDKQVLINQITTNLIALLRETDPKLFPSELSDSDITQEYKIEAAIKRTLVHYAQIVEVFGGLYYDVGNKISPAKMDLSFFRSQPYFEQLEKSMEEFIQFSGKSVPGKGAKKGFA